MFEYILSLNFFGVMNEKPRGFALAVAIIKWTNRRQKKMIADESYLVLHFIMRKKGEILQTFFANVKKTLKFRRDLSVNSIFTAN